MPTLAVTLPFGWTPHGERKVPDDGIEPVAERQAGRYNRIRKNDGKGIAAIAHNNI